MDEKNVFDTLAKQQPKEYRKVQREDHPWGSAVKWWFIMLPHILKRARKTGTIPVGLIDLVNFAKKGNILPVTDVQIATTTIVELM